MSVHATLALTVGSRLSDEESFFGLTNQQCVFAGNVSLSQMDKCHGQGSGCHAILVHLCPYAMKDFGASSKMQIEACNVFKFHVAHLMCHSGPRIFECLGALRGVGYI